MTATFTKDELRKIADRCDDDQPVLYRYLAEYSLAQTEAREKAETTCKELLQVQSERDRLAKELAEAEEAILRLLSLPQCHPITGEAVVCVACGQRKAPVGRDAPSILHLCDHECVGYKADPRPGFLWPGETLEEFGYPEESARADGDLRVALQHPAIRRASERGKG